MFDKFSIFSSGRMNVCLLLLLAMLVTMTMALSPRKLHRHVNEEDRPVYNVTTLNVFFAYVLSFVYINRALYFYTFLGEITNMNHKCISLSILSSVYHGFFVALWGSILSSMRRLVRSFNIPSLGYLTFWGLRIGWFKFPPASSEP